MIVDSFIYYNELDLLNYRLEILNDYIDYFILVESTHTFTGKPKPLYYNENKEKFAKFNDKIIHIVVDDFPYKQPNINFVFNHQWKNEYFQRNCIVRGLQLLQSSKQTFKNEDVILTSDIDEIPDPNILLKIKNNTLDFDKNNLNKLTLDMYYYNLHYKVGDGQNWNGIKLFTWKAFKNIRLTFQQMRVWEHTHHVNAIAFGGWHLSYFGNIDFIINKIQSFAHQEYNNDNYLNKEKLKNDIENGINFIGGLDLQYIKIKDNVNLPPKYDVYLKKFYKND